MARTIREYLSWITVLGSLVVNLFVNCDPCHVNSADPCDSVKGLERSANRCSGEYILSFRKLTMIYGIDP